MGQTSYSLLPAVGIEGQLADDMFTDKWSRLASGAVPIGKLCQLGGYGANKNVLDSGECVALPTLAADAAAIVTTRATSGAIQNLVAADLNGVSVGAGKMVPARRLTFTANANANWSATAPVVISGVDEMGRYIAENVTVASGGGAAYTTLNYFSKVTGVTVPAEGGTGGTFTIGVLANDGLYHPADCGIAIFSQDHDAYINNAYSDKDSVSILHKGRVNVIPETNVVAGDPVFVRMLLSGNNIMGQFGAGPLANFSRMVNACFTSNATAGQIAVLERF